MLVSICGASASGKTTLSNMIMKHYNNTLHIDIDKIGHDVMNIDTVKEELVKKFGTSNRKDISNLVFSSKENMDILIDITWKYMDKEISKIIDDNNDKLIILDWILIYNTSYFDKSDIKILLDIPYDVRASRVLKRDNISIEEFNLRDRNSIKYDINRFDLVIRNDKEMEKVYDKSIISR